MRKYRIALCVAGGLLLAFGAFRLVTKLDPGDLLALALWLVAAVALHDGVIAPLTVGTGRAPDPGAPARTSLPPGRAHRGRAHHRHRDPPDLPTRTPSRRSRPSCCATTPATSRCCSGS